jgi:hypothetical protein
MTTYMVALAVLALFYGLFWNNRTAKELASLDNPVTKQDDGATRTGVLPGRGNSQRSAS